MNLDFSGLEALTNQNAESVANDFDADPFAEPLTEEELHIELLQREIEAKRRERADYVGVLRTYQENTKKAERITQGIRRGVKKGVGVELLLLKACEALSMLTGDERFYKDVERALAASYGIETTAEQLRIDGTQPQDAQDAQNAP